MSDAAGIWPGDEAPEETPACGPGPFAAGQAAVTVAILVLVTIVAFESMALTTIMPVITEDLHSVRIYSIAFSALLTAQLVGIVLAGVWTDRHGPLPGMVAGQLLLAGGSAVCAIATHFATFVAGRVLVGLGGGILVVLLYVVIGRMYAESVRPRLFTLVSAAWILPSLLGAPISAAITNATSWRVVFWVLIPPILLTALFLSWRARSRREQLGGLGSPRDHAEHVRVARAGVGIALSAGLFQWGTTQIAREARGHAIASVVGAIGVLLLAPRLVPSGTWRFARGLPAVLLSRALIAAAFFGALPFAPLMLVRDRHLSLAAAGVLVSVGSVGWAAGAVVQGLPRFHDRRAELVTVGGALTAVGLVLLGAVSWCDLPTWLVTIPFLVAGVGMGLAIASQAVLALAITPVAEHGQASSALQLADVLGSVVGIAGGGVVFAIDHVRRGSDAAVYGEIWVVLGLVAALVVLAGRRIGPARS